MHKLKRLIVVLVTLIVATVFTLPVNAQQEPGSGLSISPTLAELTVQPGANEKLEINLKNVTANRITAKASIYDFESDNLTGNPKIITDPKQASPNSIRRFIQGLSDVDLDVGQQKKFSLTANIPSDTAPGAYFGIIRYKAVPVGQAAPAEGQLSLSASVGTIVLISVPGDVREQVQLSGLHVYRGGYDGGIFVRKPDKVGVEIRNLGNSFVKPFGTVEIQNTFGKNIYTYQLNNTNPRSTVLPDSRRIFEDGLKNISQPGRYTVTASVSYGSGGQVLTLKKTFWYIPIWLAVVIIVVLLILVFLVFRAYRRFRRDSKRAYRRRS